MSRLPTPGKDSGTWGQILNQYLLIAHNNDGTLKSSAVTAGAIKDGSVQTSKLQDSSVSSAKLQNGSVTSAKLSTTGAPTSGQVLSYNGSTLAWTNAGSSNPAMGGDLSGTASNAQIVAGAVTATELATGAVTTTKIGDSQVTSAKIGDGQVTTTKIADANVTTAKLGDNQVTTAKIADGQITTTKIVDANVTEAKLESAVQTKLNAADTILVSKAGTAAGTRPELNFVEGSNVTIAATDDSVNDRVNISISATTGSGTPADATTTSKGVVQLAGDLDGTADAPTVPGLSGKEPAITGGTTSQYWRGDKSWQTLDKSAVGLGNVTNDAQVKASNLAATADAQTGTDDTKWMTPLKTKQAITTFAPSASDATASTKGVLKLTGDLGGTADVPTVPGLANKEPAISSGTTAQYWRGDKSWQTLNATAVGLGNVTNDAQVKASDKAAQADAQAGTDDTKWMTPLKTQEAIAALSGSISVNWETSLGYVLLDNFSGTTDDDKLTAALTYMQAQTYPPILRLRNRQYTFTQGARQPFANMRIRGPEGYSNPERSSQAGMVCRVTLSGITGGWFHNTSSSDIFGVSFSNLSITGGSSASVITQSSTAGSLYCLQMRDISTTGLKTVLGTQSQKLTITAATFDGGAWEINNCYNGAFHLGGSDNTLWPDGCLLDSGTAFNTAGSAAGQYHLWCDYLEKTTIGPMYITCEGNWGGMRVSGPTYNSGGSNSGMIMIHGAKIEGRNPGAPCNGANVLVDGGMLFLDHCWVAYGMNNPTSMGHSTTDAGVIHQSAGIVDISRCVYDRATGQAETVPFAYSSGGLMDAEKVRFGSRGGTWTGLPRIDQAGGTVTADTTVTVI